MVSLAKSSEIEALLKELKHGKCQHLAHSQKGSINKQSNDNVPLRFCAVRAQASECLPSNTYPWVEYGMLGLINLSVAVSESL